MTASFLENTSAIFLFEEAEALGLQPKWENAYGFFSIHVQGKKEFIFHTKFHCNSDFGAWICKNKHATHLVLEPHGFSLIPYRRSNKLEEIQAFFNEHQIIVKKPIIGMQSQGVELISTMEQLENAPLRGVLFEKYIKGTEYRYLALNEKIVAVQEKTLMPTETDPWNPIVQNLPQRVWNSSLASSAIKIATLLKLGFVAVDFLIDKNDKAWILEVNNMPSLHYFHKPHKGKPVNIARILLQELFFK